MPVKTPAGTTQWFHMKQLPQRQHREDAAAKAAGADPVVYYWEAVAQTDQGKVSVETPDLNSAGQACVDNGAGTAQWLASVKPEAVRRSTLTCFEALRKALAEAGYTGAAIIGDVENGFDEGYNGMSLAYNRWLEAQKPAKTQQAVK